MSFKSLFGQSLAVELAQRWLRQETTHPLLFYGPEGVGKRTLARELAKGLNCEINRPDEKRVVEWMQDACDMCQSCKKIAADHHPDVRLIDMNYQAVSRGELVEKQQALRIETIQEERRRLLQSSVEGRWKVSVLDDAHRLTQDAANALLKILEEPPPRTALILITPYRDRLFATLQSRCQPMRFRPLTDVEMKQTLTQHQIPQSTQIGLIEMALGSPGKALRMNREEDIQTAVDMERLWKDLPGKTLSEICRQEARVKGNTLTRADAEIRLQHLQRPILRDLHGGIPDAVAWIALVQDAQQQLRQNVQPGLVYDHLLLKLAQQRRESERDPS